MRKMLTLAIFVVSLSGCATIIQSSKQNVGVSSSPSQAKVLVNNVELGVTPIILPLKRKENHVISINLEGYQPYQATLSRGLSGWVVGNIIFGGIIGLVVDAATGAMYKLSPEQITGNLAKITSQTSIKDGDLYIFVTLQPDPTWQYIGSLEKE
jgi:hypothetical protein